MKDKIINKRKTFNAILTYISIILLVLGIITGIYEIILLKNKLDISATITSVNYNQGSTNASIKYYVAGKKYEGIIKIDNSSNLAVNDTTIIHIDMRNPNYQIDKRYLIISISSIVLSIIFGIIAIPTFIKNKKNQKRIKMLKQNGVYLKIPIKEIYANNKGKPYKKIFPRRLRCQYLNPQDNKEYIFDSEDTFLNLEEIIKENNTKDAVVYMDKSNYTNYYLDLNSLVPQINIINPIEFMKSSGKKEE